VLKLGTVYWWGGLKKKNPIKNLEKDFRVAKWHPPREKSRESEKEELGPVQKQESQIKKGVVWNGENKKAPRSNIPNAVLKWTDDEAGLPSKAM